MGRDSVCNVWLDHRYIGQPVCVSCVVSTIDHALLGIGIFQLHCQRSTHAHAHRADVYQRHGNMDEHGGRMARDYCLIVVVCLNHDCNLPFQENKADSRKRYCQCLGRLIDNNDNQRVGNEVYKSRCRKAAI